MEGRLALRHGSLFSGIGGFDIAAEWCGWKNVFHCEINEFCNHILNYYWPKAASIKNIVNYEWEKWKGKIDVLTGGFPCQPYSTAGKRLGNSDPRHLWPAMLRAIKSIRPLWVVGENVRGLISWNGGLVFDQVQSELEDAGYEVLPFLLPAAGVNAPHRRERIWFVARRKRSKNRRASIANPDNRQQQEQQECRTKKGSGTSEPRSIPGIGAGSGDSNGNTAQGIRQLETGPQTLHQVSANPIDLGCNHRGNSRKERQFPNDERTAEKDQQSRKEWQPGIGAPGKIASDTYGKGIHGRQTSGDLSHEGKEAVELPWGYDQLDHWEHFPSQSPVCFRNDGLSYQVDADTIFEGIPFPIKPISFSKWRMESIKSQGNAIVPKVALQIFRAIQQYEASLKKR